MSAAQAAIGAFGAAPAAAAARARHAARAHDVDTTIVNVLTADLIITLLFQKLAIPMGGQLASVVVTHLACLCTLLYWGKATLSTYRCFLYLLTFTLAIVLNMLGPTYNIGSFFLFCATALAFNIVIPTNMETYLAFLRRFQLVGLGVVGLVFFDHAMQVVGPGMPNLEQIIPTSVLYTNYVYIQPLYWSSVYSKPNAIFFLEASVTSQFLAFCVLIELGIFRRLLYIVLLGTGIMAVFAGTGFVLLIAISPLLVKHYVKPRFIIIGAVLLLIAGGIGLATGWVDIMLMRSGEFEKNGSSGHARFVAPFEAVIDQFRYGSTASLIFGDGAGMQDKGTDIMLIPFTKTLLEYGFIVVILYTTFTLGIIFGSGVPFICAWAVFIFFHILNGGSTFPLCDTIAYFVAAGYSIRPAAQRERSAGAVRTAAVDAPPPARAAPLTAFG